MCLLLVFARQVSAQNADVTFFVIGKHANFSQDASGKRESIDYSFFSEIFLASNGDANHATLVLPTGERIDFKDMREAEDSSRDNILLISGADRFTQLPELQARYPDGEFVVSFSTPSGNVDSVVLKFDNRGLPTAPKISVRQGGSRHCNRLVPGVDAIVSWGPFEQGRADPNGILDDLVFVILTDADGNRVDHSGRPFEGRPYLTFAMDNYTIPGAVLQPGKNYILSVEHAILDDTARIDSVPAFTTRAVTTKIEMSTFADGALETRCDVQTPIALFDSKITLFLHNNFESKTPG